MAKATTSAEFNAGFAGVIGTVTGVAVYGLIHGIAAFDLTRTEAIADLLLHAGLGAAVFAGGAVVRNLMA